MTRVARFLETLANLAIVVTCAIVLTTVAIQRFKPRTPARSTPDGVGTALKAGDRFPERVIDASSFREAERTLVMYVKSTCRFCEASGPFYQRIAATVKLKKAQGLKLIVLTTDTPSDLAQYIATFELSSARLIHADDTVLADLRLPGTPSLVLVNRSGMVQQVWVGQLNDQKQADVMSTISSPRTSN